MGKSWNFILEEAYRYSRFTVYTLFCTFSRNSNVSIMEKAPRLQVVFLHIYSRKRKGKIHGNIFSRMCNIFKGKQKIEASSLPRYFENSNSGISISCAFSEGGGILIYMGLHYIYIHYWKCVFCMLYFLVEKWRRPWKILGGESIETWKLWFCFIIIILTSPFCNNL